MGRNHASYGADDDGDGGGDDADADGDDSSCDNGDSAKRRQLKWKLV